MAINRLTSLGPCDQFDESTGKPINSMNSNCIIAHMLLMIMMIGASKSSLAEVGAPELHDPDQTARC